MIALKRLNGDEFVLNADFLESLEATPDTVLLMTSGKRIMVKNSVEDVVRRVIKYKQLCNTTVKIIQEQQSGPSDIVPVEKG